MRLLLLLIVFVSIVYGRQLYVINTEDILGKLTIEAGDFIIIHPEHQIVFRIPANVTVILCETNKCKEYEMERIEHLYRSSLLKATEIK